MWEEINFFKINLVRFILDGDGDGAHSVGKFIAVSVEAKNLVIFYRMISKSNIITILYRHACRNVNCETYPTVVRILPLATF